MEEFRRSLERVAGQVQQLERRFAAKAPQGVLEARVVALETSVREKACGRQLHALDVTLMGIASKIPALEQIHKHGDAVERMQKQLYAIQESGAAPKLASVLQSIQANKQQIQKLDDLQVEMQAQIQETLESDIPSKVACLERSMMSKASLDHVQQLADAGGDDRNIVQHLKDTVVDLNTQVSDIVNSLQDKASVLQMGELEHMLAQKPDMRCVHNLQHDVVQVEKNLRSALEAHSARIDQSMLQKANAEESRDLAAGIESKIGSMEQNLQLTCGMAKQHESAMKSTEARLGQIELAWNDKAGKSAVEELRGSVSCWESEISDLRESVKEKVCLTKLNSISTEWQIQMTQIETSLQQKVNLDRMQQLSSMATDFNVKVNSLEQDLQSGVSHMQLLEQEIASLQKQLSETRDAKADEVQVLRNSVSAVEMKLKGVDRSCMAQLQNQINTVDATLQAGAVKLQSVPRLENSVASIQAQLASLEQVAFANVDARATQQLESTIGSVEAAVDVLERQAKQWASRLKHLEDSVENVDSDFFGFQQGLDEAFSKRRHTPPRRHTSSPSSKAPTGNPQLRRRSHDSAPY